MGLTRVAMNEHGAQLIAKTFLSCSELHATLPLSDPFDEPERPRRNDQLGYSTVLVCGSDNKYVLPRSL